MQIIKKIVTQFSCLTDTVAITEGMATIDHDMVTGVAITLGGGTQDLEGSAGAQVLEVEEAEGFQVELGLHQVGLSDFTSAHPKMAVHNCHHL